MSRIPLLQKMKHDFWIHHASERGLLSNVMCSWM